MNLTLPVLWGTGGVICAQTAANVLSAVIDVPIAVRLYKELKEEG